MLGWFYSAIANSIVGLHALLEPVFGRDSGLTWGFSIVLLVVAIRILLFPLFVKQIKVQRKMMELQPKIKEIQNKYRGDREKLNTELMKVYRENNANPLGGCLPLLVQMPIFFALFKVLDSFKPKIVDGVPVYRERYGISQDLVQSAAEAKIFGAPIAVSFNSGSDLLEALGASVGVAKGVTLAMVLFMTATTFITQKQLMSRNALQAGTPMAQQQKILLYVLPISFGLFGILGPFPVGVLLYWLTTNIWTMGQQFLVINRMHPPTPAVATGGKAAPAGGGKTAAAAGDAPAASGGTTQVVRQQPVRRKSGKSSKNKKRKRR